MRQVLPPIAAIGTVTFGGMKYVFPSFFTCNFSVLTMQCECTYTFFREHVHTLSPVLKFHIHDVLTYLFALCIKNGHSSASQVLALAKFLKDGGHKFLRTSLLVGYESNLGMKL